MKFHKYSKCARVYVNMRDNIINSLQNVNGKNDQRSPRCAALRRESVFNWYMSLMICSVSELGVERYELQLVRALIISIASKNKYLPISQPFPIFIIVDLIDNTE